MKDSATLRLEVGKYYRTRDGRKVRIYALDGEGGFPIHGAVLEADGWDSSDWTLSGVSVYTGPENIVGEWLEAGPLAGSEAEAPSQSEPRPPAPGANNYHAINRLQNPSSSSPVCECGGDKAGGTHSDWCPKGAGK
jgi:hypothetical protein